MKIPSDNKWIQTNDGDILGVLHETHNISLDRRGEIALTRKALALVDSSTTNFEKVLAIVYFDGKYHVVTSGKVFAGDLAGNDFDAVSSSPSFTVGSDAVVCYGLLYISDTTSLASLDTGGDWTTGIGSLSNSYPHPLAVFDALTTYKLAVGNGPNILTYDSSGNANSTTLTLPSNYVATTLAYRNGYLYIGTKEINGGEAAIFMWNGDGSNAQYMIPVGAGWVYSMVPYKGSVVCVTNEGELLYVNGTATEQLAALPVFYAQGARWEQGNATLGKVYPRGLAVMGDNVYVNVNGNVEVGEVAEMKSGVWCFDPSLGLYHYASPSTDLWVSDSGVSNSSGTLTTTATHNLVLGDLVIFTAVSGLSISEGVPYYAIPVSANTLKVAGSRQDAFDGNYIAITGTATSDAINYAPNTDYGHRRGESGAIAITNYLDSSYELFGTDIMFGSEVQNNADSEKDVLCVLSSRYNEGSFTTQKIFTSNVTSVWKSVYSFVRGLLGSNESAIIKYRKTDRPTTKTIAIVWSDESTFVTTDPAVKNILEVGDEVAFMDGRGQGRYAHITAVTYSTNTTEVVIDESYGSAGATGDAQFMNFKKVAEITSTRENESWQGVPLDAKNTWIQVKVELRGFEPSVQMLEITNSTDKSAL